VLQLEKAEITIAPLALGPGQATLPNLQIGSS